MFKDSLNQEAIDKSLISPEEMALASHKKEASNFPIIFAPIPVLHEGCQTLLFRQRLTP